MTLRSKAFLLGAMLVFGSVQVCDARQLVVIDSSSPQYKAGQVIEGSQRLQLSSGSRMTVVGDDGKVIKLEGPFSGVVGTASEPGNSGGVVVVEAISKLFSGETPETGALGTFRGSRGAGQTGTKAPDVWAIDVSQSETQCVPGGMVPTLWRSQASRELTIAVEFLTSKTGTLVQFPAGVDVVAWPVQVPLEDGGRYSIRDSNDTWRSGLTLRIIPVEQTSTVGRAAWMAENGCAAQARTLMANL